MDVCSSTGRCTSAFGPLHRRAINPTLWRSAVQQQVPSLSRRGRRNATVVASAAAAVPGDNSGNNNFAQQVANFPNAFWKFLRPHTIRGTILGTTAVTAKALLEHPECIDWGLLPRALLGLVALLCGNGYIVGINQIYDVEIDQVNKPFLPVASGELSPVLAWGLCLSLAAGGVALVASNFGSLITSLYSLGLFLGTIYSIPPLRLKQYAVSAFMIIATVRGFLLNFGVYYATRAALELPFEWSPAISFITIFVTVFATVIAITKDLPDVEGDQKNNIETFATRVGVRRVAQLGIGLLMTNYLGAVALALSFSSSFNVAVMAGAHALLGLVLFIRSMKLHAEGYTKGSVESFYRWIWGLFYAEYCLLPFL